LVLFSSDDGQKFAPQVDRSNNVALSVLLLVSSSALSTTEDRRLPQIWPKINKHRYIFLFVIFLSTSRSQPLFHLHVPFISLTYQWTVPLLSTMTIYNSTYSWPLYNNANTNYCYYYHILVYVYKQALYISIQSFVYNDKMF